jgi:hypothetical protein
VSRGDAVLLKALVVWFLTLAVAVANGALRVFVIDPLAGEATGHIASSLLLCVFIIAIAGLTVRWIGANDPRSLFTVGGAWLALTLAFEFLGGHYLFHKSWDVLLANYDIPGGRIWVLVLVTTFFAPLLGAKLRGELGQE